MQNQFDEAVLWLTGLLSQYVRDGKLEFPRIEPKEVVYRLQFGVHWIPEETDDGGTTIAGYWAASQEACDFLLSVCEQDAAAFDLCKAIAAEQLITGKALIPAIRTFSALVVSGEIARPKTTRRSVTWLRNMYLLTMAKVVEGAFRLSLTRNDEGKNQISACDAVATALAASGHHISYRAIKEICVGSGKENRELRAEFAKWIAEVKLAAERDPAVENLFRRERERVGANKLPPS